MTKLYADALRLSVNENLQNVHTLLNWAEDNRDLDQTLQHLERAHELLGEVVLNLQELRRQPSNH